MNRRRWLILLIAVLIVSVGTVLFWYVLRTPPQPTPPEEPLPGEEVILYFLNRKGYHLQIQRRELPEAKNKSQRVTQIVRELTRPPEDVNLIALVPGDLELRSVFIGDQTVYLDFNDALIGAAQGSSGEMMLLYSIVNSVLANLPRQYKLVRFLVDGEKRKTIGAYGEESGHIAIQYPLGPKWDLTAPSS